MENKTTRVTVDFSAEAYQALDEVAKRIGGSKAEALRRSLGAYRFILRQQQEGWDVMLEKGGERKQLVTT
ncbi:hypothetical protein [Trinickia sp. Y13]|uniref:hypothetical protein n=1 Tax=Trinickia sp. Y13 TaxID=2917807 RepID=UPI002404A38C|nr:hypothetical protein [Trinickia sp. Y13]MDG0022725.1 hypothetical protein [Trinickia sp. Y13]